MSQAEKDFVSLAYWVADQYDGDERSWIRNLTDLVVGGKPGDKVHRHGDPVRFEEALDYLHAKCTHIRAWPDRKPAAITFHIWDEKLERLAETIEQLRRQP